MLILIVIFCLLMSSDEIYTTIAVLNPFNALNTVKNVIYWIINIFFAIVFLGYLGRYAYMKLGKNISNETIFESWVFWRPDIELLVIGGSVLTLIVVTIMTIKIIWHKITKQRKYVPV